MIICITENIFFNFQPLIVSQNKIKNNITTMKSLTVSMKKRALDTSEETHVTNSDDSQKSNPNKKARPSLLDSKKSKNSNKYNEEADGEELSEESEEQDENIEEDVEEEDIDSAAAEEDEDEEKQIEDFDEDDLGEGPVGNEISDPIIHVRGEGSGKECDSENNWYFGESDFGYDYKPTVGDAIEENVLVVYGEGFGKDCLVGNVKTDTNKADGESTVSVTTDEKKRESTQHSEDLKKSPEKPTDILKSSESPTTQLDHETANSSSKEEIKICSGLETNNTDGSNVEEVLKISSGSQEQNEGDKNDKTNKTTKAENDKLNEKEKDDRGPEAAEQAKNVCLSELAKDEAKPRKSETKSTSENITIVSTNANSNVWSRKRRLEDFAIQQTRNQHSESEIDINSEHTEEMQKEQGIDADELDIGGKRPKMRQKQNNSELRKKVEAQKAADREETTSSSGGEENTQRRRKLISPKKHTERILKTEVENKSSNDNSSANSTNGQQKKGAHEKSTSTFPSGNVIIKQTPSTSTTTNVKHKPTLAEIIEKKLKKTHELDDKPCKSTTDDVTTESTISPPKKFPVTKPLKKNLLTQIRQQSTDSEYKMPQSGIKDSTVVITAPDTKEKVTPERQRKRHSSEETDRSDIPEEPEAKKEVLCDDFKEIPGESEVKKENLCDDFKQKESICMKNPAKDLVDMKDNVKEEIKSEEPKSIGNRRSGRRGTLSVACPEVSKAKRTRGGIKKDENDAKTKLEIAPKNITNKDNTAEKNTNDKKVVSSKLCVEIFCWKRF